MNKKILGKCIILLLLAIFLTGCGEKNVKTLHCSKEYVSSKGTVTNVDLSIKFNKKNATEGNATYMFYYAMSGTIEEKKEEVEKEADAIANCEKVRSKFENDYSLLVEDCDMRIENEQINKYTFETKWYTDLKLDLETTKKYYKIFDNGIEDTKKYFEEYDVFFKCEIE